jgi:hypothetical protein
MSTTYSSRIGAYGVASDIQYYINTYRKHLFDYITDLYDRYASFHDIDLSMAYKIHRSADYKPELVYPDIFYINAPDFIPPEMLVTHFYDAISHTDFSSDDYKITLQNDIYTYVHEARALSALYPEITILYQYGSYDNDEYKPIEAIYWQAGTISDHIYCAVTDLPSDRKFEQQFCCTLVRHDYSIRDLKFTMQVRDDDGDLIVIL